MKYHKIETNVALDLLTRSQASRLTDRIILQYGKMIRVIDMMHFRDKKTKRILSGILVVLIVIAMVLPTLAAVIGMF